MIRQARYTFRARLANRWRRGRVFLLGDAAHLTPPFIGQGLCAGLRDARNLTWKLARVLHQGADDRLLDTYQQEPKPHARHVIRVVLRLGRAAQLFESGMEVDERRGRRGIQVLR
ncbi:FAD-dependent monooxygenase [Streptomyces sp. NPDC007856]|uniref:FAD-dependent monooxygenase n=1 Tax=Streptomyces sp. NPDC007856 TaxID=3364781 RepID=UPI0036789457